MNKIDVIPTIVLTGLKHSGKSSLARIVSQDLAYKSFDLDAIVANIIRNDGLSQEADDSQCVRAFYKEYGVQAFRDLEVKAFKQLESAQLNENEGSVLALGGGSMENTELITAIKLSNSIMVFIDVAESVLYSRIIKNGIPAFLDQNNARESFASIFTKRRSIAQAQSDIIVDGNNLDLMELAKNILRALEEFVNGRK